MTKTVVIALDGPAGAGRTVAERLAGDRATSLRHWRAVSRGCRPSLELGTNASDEAALGDLVSTIDILVRPPTVEDGRQVDVLVEGRDVSHEIRTPAVDQLVSRVAASPAVRTGLIDLQRRQVQGRGTDSRPRHWHGGLPGS